MHTETLPFQSTSSPRSASRGLHRALWGAQAVVALPMLLVGVTKLTVPLDQLAMSMRWIPDFAPLAVRGIGAAELLAALGLVLPSALRILPRLTPLAALGLTALMLGAVHTELRVTGPGGAVAPAVFALLSLFIAWGRGRAAPIAPRASSAPS